MIDFLLNILEKHFTLENWIAFALGFSFCRFWYRKEISRFTCHSCKKGHYRFDQKRVRDDPFLFEQNKQNGYVCDYCGKNAPYRWHI